MELARQWDTQPRGASAQPVWESNSPPSWVPLQLTSGSAPDLIWYWTSPSDSFANIKELYDFGPALQQKNPYSPNKTWLDDFDKQLMRTYTNGQGQVWTIPIESFGVPSTTTFIYNKTLLDKVGLGNPIAWTWDQFLSALAKIQKAGYTPFLMNAAGTSDYGLDWSHTSLVSTVWPELLPLLRRKIDPSDFIIPTAPPTAKMEVYAMKKGILSLSDPHMVESLRMLKQWSTYWQPGFLSPFVGDPFANGQAAFRWAGIWEAAGMQAGGLKFEYGTMAPPPITKASSPYATGAPTRCISTTGLNTSPDAAFSMPQSTVKNGRTSLALDFLQFITAPAQNAYYRQHDGKIEFTAGESVSKIFPNPTLRRENYGFYDDPLHRAALQVMDNISPGAGTASLQQMQIFLGNGQSAADTAKQLQRIALQETQKVIAEHPEWHADKW
jgi:ABC-type glycerol-3-phosphate transport system substrate-binding protein